MRIVALGLLLSGLALAGRPESTGDAIGDWPLQEAREIRIDLDVMITAVTPNGEDSATICILGPIQRLGEARRGVKLPRHWFWIAEAQRGFDPSMIPALNAAKAPGLSIYFAQNLRDTRPFTKLESLRYLAIRSSPLQDVAPLAELPALAALDLQNSRNLIDIGPLVKLKGLRALNVSGCMQVSADSLRAIAEMPDLRWLGLEQTRADDALMGKLPKGLRVLQLRGTSVGDKGLAALAKRCPDLRAIGLESCPVTDKGVSALKGLKKLEAIDLALTRVSSQSLKTIAKFKELRYLSLENVKLPSRALKGWRGNPKLETLLLQNSEVGAAGLKAIAKRTSLRHLQLGGDSIDDKGVRELAALTAMQRLYLHHCANVTEDGLTPMLAAMPGLKTLGLRRTEVRDANLAQIGKLAQLEWLDLGMCGWFTDAGLDHLHSCKTLRQIRLGGCRQLTPAGIDRLRKALPQAQVSDPDRMAPGGAVPARPFPR